MEKCDKPLNKELVKKNCAKYYAAKIKAQGQNAGGDGDKNKKRDKKKKDADPVISQRKRWPAAGIKLVDNISMVICKECGLNNTRSLGFHATWASNKSSVCLPDTGLFVVEKALLASANHTPAAIPAHLPAPSSNTLTFSRAELEAKVVDTEQNPTGPNSYSLAQTINIKQGVDQEEWHEVICGKEQGSRLEC